MNDKEDTVMLVRRKEKVSTVKVEDSKSLLEYHKAYIEIYDELLSVHGSEVVLDNLIQILDDTVSSKELYELFVKLQDSIE